MKTFFFLLFMAVALHITTYADEPPRQIKFVIDGYNIPKNVFSLYVKEIGVTKPVLDINSDKALNPASAIKIIPTLAALELLGPAYRWRTAVYTSGKIQNGTLHGDILFKGHGDPYFVTEEFWKLLRELKRRGIKHIKGDFLIDDSYFQLPHEDPGAFDNKPYRTYNVSPNAFLVNFKAAYFHFYPAKNGKGAVVSSDPELANLNIDNRLRLRKSRCGGFQRGIAVTIPDGKLADKIIFDGRFPSGCEHYVMSRSVLTHKTFAFGAFKSLWEGLGGSISGQVKSATAPQGQTPFLTWDSKSLSEVIKLINKFSNNVMTRQLLLTLGAELAGQPGTVDKGVGVIEAYLNTIGVNTGSLNIVNGSGLSRNTRTSTRLLAELLEHAYALSLMPEFVSSLSIIGIDGTARSRFRYAGATGAVHVKTGTIDHVSAIAGYVHSRSGKKFIVSGMVNHPEAHRGPGEELMSAMVNWAYNQ